MSKSDSTSASGTLRGILKLAVDRGNLHGREDYADALQAFLRTADGAALWSQFIKSINTQEQQADESAVATARGTSSDASQQFIAKARAYGKEHDCKNDSEAFVAYASTADGRTAYATYRNSLGRDQASGAAPITDETGTRRYNPNKDHAFPKAVVDAVRNHGLPPMLSAAVLKEQQPDLYAAYLKDCEETGTHPNFNLPD